VRDNILALDVDFGNPNDYWILDVRPLPCRSVYKSSLCTVGLLYLMDASSTKVLRHKILPREDEDDAGHRFGIDFTCQHIREEIAMAIIENHVRPRIIYVDNASIFQALHKFLDFITSEGEEPTEIIHTVPGEPRGRGVMERGLGLMNQFAQYKPGFYVEDDYRKSLRNKKRYKNYDFAFLEKEFEHFMPFRNARQWEEGRQKLPSPDECYKQGPNKGLRAPSEFQLALFAGTLLKDKRVPSRKGIQYEKQWYVPASEAPEIGELLTSAVLAKQDRALLVAQIGDFRTLYVQLDGKTWEPFIEANKRQWSAKKRKEWNDAVRQRLNDSQKASIERLQLALLTDLDAKLVIDPYNQSFVEHVPSAPQAPALMRVVGDEKTEDRTEIQSPEKTTGQLGQNDKPAKLTARQQRNGAREGSSDHSQGDGSAAPIASSPVPPSSVEQPQSPGFLSRRRQQLQQTEEEQDTP
jgi:hypothetical protein